MSDSTNRLSLPLLVANQAQKHITHNEALLLLDGMVQLAFHEDVTVPPSSAAAPAAYLVPSGASGDWAGQAGRIALADGASWRFIEPREGWQAWSLTRGEPRVFDGAVWIALTRRVERMGVNAEAAGAVRLAVASDDIALFPSDAAADLRLKLNAAAGRAAAISFETDWSGRFELAHGADDDLVLKASPDGAVWTEVWRVDPTTGRIGFGGHIPSSAALTGPGTAMIRGVGSTYSTTLDLSEGALIIQSSQTATAQFRLLPFFDDIYFQNTLSSGSIWFTGGSGATLTGDVRFKTTGRVAVGDITPTTRLHVDGPVRVGQATVADAPSPTTAGAGAIIFISDETGGPTLAVSDGSAWRRVTDRAVIA